MGGAIAAGAGALVAVVAVVGLIIVTRRASRSLRTAEDELDQVRAAAVAALDGAGQDARERLDRAVTRAETAVTTAETAVAAAETASRIAEAALTAPAVKARAWGAGTAAAARTLRDRRAPRRGSE